MDNAGSRISSIGEGWSDVRRGISSSWSCVERRAAFSAIISISELVRCNPLGASFFASTALILARAGRERLVSEAEGEVIRRNIWEKGRRGEGEKRRRGEEEVGEKRTHQHDSLSSSEYLSNPTLE